MNMFRLWSAALILACGFAVACGGTEEEALEESESSVSTPPAEAAILQPGPTALACADPYSVRCTGAECTREAGSISTNSCTRFCEQQANGYWTIATPCYQQIRDR
jgi:hypothetical protein